MKLLPMAVLQCEGREEPSLEWVRVREGPAGKCGPVTGRGGGGCVFSRRQGMGREGVGIPESLLLGQKRSGLGSVQRWGP